MAGLSLIVFPVLGVIGVVKHLSTPNDKRTEKANTYFKRYLLGVALTWAGFELNGQIDSTIVFVMLIAGIYMCLFSGISLFSEDPIKVIEGLKTDTNIKQNFSPILEKKFITEKSSISSVDTIINPQKNIYDEEVTVSKSGSIKSSEANSRVIKTISSKGWKYDKKLRVLWNESTNEILRVSSGLGFSITSEYFMLYNRLEPRKIQINEVVEENFQK
jgi:hypothetical protein